MVGHTTKVKIAAGIAAAGLALGAAGAYAANANNNGSIPVSNLKPVTLSGAGAGTLTLKSTNGKTTTLTIPATFPNLGQCVSLFAKHQDLVPTPAAGTTRISKNSHGKLVSTIKAFCQPLVTSTKTDSAATETPDATQTAAPESDATDSQSGASHGHGNGHGHGKHATQTN
jgi:hypothetical protein